MYTRTPVLQEKRREEKRREERWVGWLEVHSTFMYARVARLARACKYRCTYVHSTMYDVRCTMYDVRTTHTQPHLYYPYLSVLQCIPPGILSYIVLLYVHTYIHIYIVLVLCTWYVYVRTYMYVCVHKICNRLVRVHTQMYIAIVLLQYVVQVHRTLYKVRVSLVHVHSTYVHMYIVRTYMHKAVRVVCGHLQC